MTDIPDRSGRYSRSGFFFGKPKSFVHFAPYKTYKTHKRNKMAQDLTPTSAHELRELNLARTILILSVVLIHSSPIARMQPQHAGQVGEDIPRQKPACH